MLLETVSQCQFSWFWKGNEWLKHKYATRKLFSNLQVHLSLKNMCKKNFFFGGGSNPGAQGHETFLTPLCRVSEERRGTNNTKYVHFLPKLYVTLLLICQKEGFFFKFLMETLPLHHSRRKQFWRKICSKVENLHEMDQLCQRNPLHLRNKLFRKLRFKSLKNRRFTVQKYEKMVKLQVFGAE